jgi:hypothetical protein
LNSFAKLHARAQQYLLVVQYFNVSANYDKSGAIILRNDHNSDKQLRNAFCHDYILGVRHCPKVAAQKSLSKK